MALNRLEMETAAANRRTKIITIDGLGDVRIRAYSSADKTLIERAHMLVDGDPTKSLVKHGRFREMACALAIVDDDGKRLYDPDKKADIDALSAFDAEHLERITREVFTLSAMTKEAQEALGKG